MELLNSTLNRCVPTRTKKEWRKDNPDYQKQYNKDNAEHIQEKNKQYRQDNAEKIKAYEKLYNIEKIPCPHCNKMLSRCLMTPHIRTQHTE